MSAPERAGLSEGVVTLLAGELVLLHVRVEISAGKATTRSLATLYGLAIGIVRTDDRAAWRAINGAISVWGSPKGLERVKRCGWQIYQAASALRAVDAAASTPPTPAGERGS